MVSSVSGEAFVKVLRKNSETFWTCVCLFCFALALRGWGCNFGLPYAEARPDEMRLISVAMSYGDGDLNPHFFNYPSLFSYLLFAVYGAYAGVLNMCGRIGSMQDILVLLVRDPSSFIILARLVSAFFGALTVPLLYILGMKIFARKTAFWAALMLAVSFLHVRESHFGVTDIAMTCLVVATLIPSVNIFISGERKYYIAAGIIGGLAASMKYNASLVALTIFVAHIVRVMVSANRLQWSWRKLGMNELCISAACMIMAFSVTSPFVLIDYKSFIRDFTFEVRHLAGAGETIGSCGWMHHFVFSLRYGIGGIVLAGALLGIACGLVKKPKETVVLLSFPLIYYLTMGRGYTVLVRYILPIIPFLYLFSSFLIWECICERLSGCLPRRYAWNLCGLLCLAMVLISIRPMISFNVLLLKKDTREELVQYINETYKDGAHIGWAGTTYGKPRIRECANSIIKRFERLNINGRGRYTETAIRIAQDGGAGYFIHDLGSEDAEKWPSIVVSEYYPLAWSEKVSRTFERILAERGYDKIRLISGLDRDALRKGLMGFDKQDSFYMPYNGLNHISRPGPDLTVWQLGSSENRR